MSSVHRQNNKPYWFCAFIDQTGKRRFKSTGTKNKKEAQRICEAMDKAAKAARAEAGLTSDRARTIIENTLQELSELSQGGFKTYTVQEFFENQIELQEKTLKPQTWIRYKGIYESFLKFLGSGKKKLLSAIGPTDIERYQVYLQKRTGQTTTNLHLKVLRVAFNKAVRKDLIRKNPAQAVDNIEVTEKLQRKPFTLPQLKTLLKNASTEWQTMILFGVYCGLRQGDAANLKWSNIDLQNRELQLYVRKTSEPQTLPLAKPLYEHLMTLPTSDDPEAYLTPSLAEKTSGWVSGQFYDLMTVCGLVEPRTHQSRERGRDRRQGNPLSFHSLRHTSTSLLKNAGVSDVIARDIIGHESAAVSRNYTHIESETKRNALNKLPDITK